MSEISGPIRVGLIGLGRSGWSIHAKAYQSIPELYRAVAVTDRIEQRMRDAAAELNAVACASVDELLAQKEIDLIIVASQNKDHRDHVVRALQAG
jgi:predicted dehydrogenase